jgi:hypothetical protein
MVAAERPADRAKRNRLPTRGQARPSIKGGLDARAIASKVKRSSGAGNGCDPDVAIPIVRPDDDAMIEAIVSSHGRRGMNEPRRSCTVLLDHAGTAAGRLVS